MVCASLVIFCTEVVILQISPLKQQYIHQHNLTIPHSVKIAFNTILSPSTTPAAQFTYNSWRLKLCHQKFSDNIYIYIFFLLTVLCIWKSMSIALRQTENRLQSATQEVYKYLFLLQRRTPQCKAIIPKRMQMEGLQYCKGTLQCLKYIHT